MSLTPARPLSALKVRSTSSRSFGHRDSSEVKDDTSLNYFPFNLAAPFVSSSGWMYLPCISFAFGHHYLMSFASSLHDHSFSVCPLDGSKLGSWSSFCLEPILSCFSTLVKFSLAFSSVVEVMDTHVYYQHKSRFFIRVQDRSLALTCQVIGKARYQPRRMTEQIRTLTSLCSDDVLDITKSHSLMSPLTHRYTYVEREPTQLLPFDLSGASFPGNHAQAKSINWYGNPGNSIGPCRRRDRSWRRRGVLYAPFGPAED